MEAFAAQARGHLHRTSGAPPSRIFRVPHSVRPPQSPPYASAGSREAPRLGRQAQAIAVAAAGATFLLGSSARRRSRRRARGASRVLRRGLEQNVPTEYYALFGLPLFTSDTKEIKSAYRRVVRLVHPDVLGVESGDLQRVVTDAYQTLSKDEERKDYDSMLRKAKPTLAKSKWGDASSELRGAFIDEVACTRCYRCVDCASSTFAIHTDPFREEKAFCALQFGDAKEVIEYAVDNCPAKAIKWHTREDLPALEYAMTQCMKMIQRVPEDERGFVPGAYELFQDNMIDQLLEMDMEKALAEAADPLSESKISEELAERARAIYEAAVQVPEDVRAQLWPQAGATEGNVAAKALSSSMVNMKAAQSPRAEAAEGATAPGLQRAALKSAVFELLDKDGDGYLYENELRPLADEYGFDGTDEEWRGQYKDLCVDLSCSAMEGLNVRSFSEMVDDKEGCYLTNSELADMLRNESLLPRAGT